MNEKNLEYLKDGLKYLGFGEKLNQALEDKIKQQPTEFSLMTVGEFKKANGTDTVDYKLDFQKSTQTDMYFFNRYHATVKGEDAAADKTQTVYINKNTGITAKEAYNLLSGRAVHKELVNAEDKPYKAWLQLDFNEKDKNDNHKIKQYHEAYGYKLEEVLKRHPIKEMENDEQKVKVLKSLAKGNTTAVTFAKDNKEEKMFIEANPKFKSVDIYDAQMRKVFQGAKEKQEPGKSQEKKETLSKAADDDDGNTKETKSKSRRVGV